MNERDWPYLAIINHHWWYPSTTGICLPSLAILKHYHNVLQKMVVTSLLLLTKNNCQNHLKNTSYWHANSLLLPTQWSSLKPMKTTIIRAMFIMALTMAPSISNSPELVVPIEGFTGIGSWILPMKLVIQRVNPWPSKILHPDLIRRIIDLHSAVVPPDVPTFILVPRPRLFAAARPLDAVWLGHESWGQVSQAVMLPSFS